jgi:hypothetical protein
MAPSSPPSSLEVKRKEEEKGIAILGPQHHYKYVYTTSVRGSNNVLSTLQ